MRATGQGEVDAASRNRGVHAEPRRGLLARLPIGAQRLLWPLLVAAVVAVLVTGVIVVVQPTGPTPAPAATQALDAPPPTSPQPGAPSATTPAATTSPAVATPTPTPTAKPTTGRPVAPAAPVATSKRKGVGVWTFDGVSQALASSGASWYYTWDVAHPGVTSPRGADFVPMCWGGK
ncbi:glycosyl hydrolase, partial [Micromonospora saelicesensis]|uniref:glycosyl hydrolase n=1 Tax=Micromonospora saelicesensis TaxID=285676 RepID=UPI0021AC0008